MYSNCIFCSGDLGRNEVVEEFPVGRALAFDAHRGRLWAVCSGCGRWNLAPIEERWEAVESAERRFRDSRLRVHSENIGLAKMPDGARLIRVGKALKREIAAWRYGNELTRRRRKLLYLGSAGVVGATALGAGFVAAAGLAALPVAVNVALHGGQLASAIGLIRSQRRVLHRLGAEGSPTGEDLLIRMGDLTRARVVPGTEGGIGVLIPIAGRYTRVETGGSVRWTPPPPLQIDGKQAERVLAKAMVSANRTGAGSRQVERALRRLEASPSRERFLMEVAERRQGIFNPMLGNQQTHLPDVRGAFRRLAGTFRGEWIAGGTMPLPPRQLPRDELLALEMTLHEESERRALEGELQELEAAWREAEEIAAIADVLPSDPLERLEL